MGRFIRYQTFIETQRKAEKNKKKRRLVRFTVLTLLFIIGFSILSLQFNSPNSQKLIDATAGLTSPFSNIIPYSKKETLNQVVDKSLEGTKGTYAVYIKNLKTGETYTKDEHRQFEAGSLYKLWVMAETYKQIESGELKEDQVLSQSIATLNSKFSIDPEFAEQTEGGITLSVANALHQMITISHNYAALLLSEKIRLSSVAEFLVKNNFNESKVGTSDTPPLTTASDIASFYEKLYKGELSTLENKEKMLGLLKKQQLRDKLPKNLPEGTMIAHKTGEIGWFSHDSGIVFLPEKGDYIIVVLSESESPAGAEERIADLSKAVFEYFNK